MDTQVDIVVIGGGPAGLNAALAAAQAGASVVLLDAYPLPGGQYYRQPPPYLAAHSTRHQREGRNLWQKVLVNGVQIISNALVWYANADKTVIYSDSAGSHTLRGRAIILAYGTYERPVAFPGWTLPGVLMAGGAQTLLYQGVLPGKRVLLAGSGPLQLVVANKLLKAGANVVGVLEGSSRLFRRSWRHLKALWGQWERLGEGLSSLLGLVFHSVPYRLGWGIVEARGNEQVESAIIARYDENWRPIPGTEKEVVCDTICMGYGFVPFTTLGKLIGIKHTWDDGWNFEVPERNDQTMETNLSGIFVVGDGAGVGGARLSMFEGQVAGMNAALQLGYGSAIGEVALQNIASKIRRERDFQRMYADLFTPGCGLFELAKDDTPICRCEGVTKRQLQDALDMGATSISEIKAMTRAGMGECQGRMCGLHLNRLIAQRINKAPIEVGLNTARPPIYPLPIKALLLDEDG
jgi:thioredoxin reductase/bacterioferritin-associated ferredoxin